MHIFGGNGRGGRHSASGGPDDDYYYSDGFDSDDASYDDGEHYDDDYDYDRRYAERMERVERRERYAARGQEGPRQRFESDDIISREERRAMRPRWPRRLLAAFLTLAVLAVGAYAGYRVWAKAPETEQGGLNDYTTEQPEESGVAAEAPDSAASHRDGVYTFLISGIDVVGYHNDTNLVGMFDTVNGKLNIVSLPRDMLVNVNLNIKKINQPYAAAKNNNQDATAALLDTVSDILGYEVDMYAFVNIEAAAEIVDAIGGVYFDIPFDTVLIHGLVRDAQGRKMSKSLGNGIDPLEIIRDYGADALRLTLVLGSTPGNDMRFSDEKVKASRNFANKLWNAARFVLMNLPEGFEAGLPAELDLSDRWVLSQLNSLCRSVGDNLEKFELGLAAQKVQDFIWDVYCDWFIEIAKLRLNSGDEQQADNARKVLVWVLDKALKLLHPFMPFITEEIYRALPGSGESIMITNWPEADPALDFAADEADFAKLMDYIKAVRTVRADMNVHPAKKTSMIIATADPEPFRRGQVYLAKFAFATDVTVVDKYEGDTAGMVQVVTHAARGFIPMMELIDREKELARLNKEKALAEKEIEQFGRQLANEGFVSKAPAKVVDDIRQKLARAQDKLANVEQSLAALG